MGWGWRAVVAALFRVAVQRGARGAGWPAAIALESGAEWSPLDWPGVHSAWALMNGQPTPGVWIDRSGMNAASRRGRVVKKSDDTEPLELRLSPLPSWANLGPLEYRRRLTEMVKAIKAETWERHRLFGTRPMGAEKVLAQSPFNKPTTKASKGAAVPHRRGGGFDRDDGQLPRFGSNVAAGGAAANRSSRKGASTGQIFRCPREAGSRVASTSRGTPRKTPVSEKYSTSSLSLLRVALSPSASTYAFVNPMEPGFLGWLLAAARSPPVASPPAV